MSIKKPVIDVVIPAHKKDLATLDHCIDGIRKNGVSVRRIIVVSKEKYTNKAEWFSEDSFPFSFKEISDLLNGNDVGWHFQQLLKLYSPLVIPDISENVLVLDADTVFLRKVKFFSDEGLPLYNLSKDQNLENSPFHQVTLRHIKKILPDIAKKLPAEFENTSGICHHMLFQKHLIEELFARVESYDNVGDKFYKIFLKNREKSFGVAEYNLYFYFLVSLHSQSYKIRVLKYKNTADFNLWKYRFRRKYHYCSFHSYMREDNKKNKCNLLQKISRIFFIEQWNIGILNFPIADIFHKKPEVKWLNNPCKLRFFADPFGFKIADKNYVIFEDYSQIKKRGRISIAALDENLNLVDQKIVLDDGKHLSYPFVINDKDSCFMICESYKSNKLSLYEIDKNKIELKKVKDIFVDKKIIDPTIIFHQEKYWMFYTTENDSNAKLHIAFADSLDGEFKEHKKNPVKDDLFSARSAGTPFIVDGVIYRPSQNCTKAYGESVVINKITELSEENFSEEFVKEIKAEYHNFGLHTISEFGFLTLTDGRKKVFLIYKPFISLIRNFMRILKKN
ncbi:MAG: hypothetical protein KGQ36_01870 [Rickettsiales bacterium]|nr:hypothetical protein [Rickettsiales bacterium]